MGKVRIILQNIRWSVVVLVLKIIFRQTLTRILFCLYDFAKIFRLLLAVVSIDGLNDPKVKGRFNMA